MDRKKKKRVLPNKLINGQKEKLRANKWTERQTKENCKQTCK